MIIVFMDLREEDPEWYLRGFKKPNVMVSGLASRSILQT